MAGLQFWEKWGFGVTFEQGQAREGFCRRGRGRSFHVDGLKTEMVQEPTMESGVRNLEVESIRSRVESMGGCV